MLETRLTILVDATPDRVPEGSAFMTALVEVPPGHVGTPPHRHSGSVFGYVTEESHDHEPWARGATNARARDLGWSPGWESWRAGFRAAAGAAKLRT